jgi:hypothetical protein
MRLFLSLALALARARAWAWRVVEAAVANVSKVENMRSTAFWEVPIPTRL